MRLFLSVGARDGLRTGDVLASIGNDAGIPGTEVGKIEIRDSHTIVEVSAAAAPVIIERVTGKTMSGRRVIVRPDQDPGERSSSGTRGREGGARRETGGPRRDGPSRAKPAPRARGPRTGGEGS